jgi:hypothetical protein
MKKKIFLAMLILMALLMIGCAGGDNSNPFDNVSDDSSESSDDTSGGSGAVLLTPVPVLFGVTPTLLQDVEESNVAQYKPANQIGTSSLYLINPLDGSAALIGDIGYNVAGIAYNAVTGKLYGITQGIALVKTPTIMESQLIEINKATGEGTYIADIIRPDDRVVSETGTKGTTGYVFTTPTFDSWGNLYAIQDTGSYHYLCTIDVTTGTADCSSNGLPAYDHGLSFDNLNNLYLITDYHGVRVYEIDTGSGTGTDVGTISGLPYYMAHDGDFNPLTGKYWGIDAMNYNTSSRSLLVIDINSKTLEDSIPTIDYLQAITFGYVDAATLTYLGLNNLINGFNYTTLE